MCNPFYKKKKKANMCIEKSVTKCSERIEKIKCRLQVIYNITMTPNLDSGHVNMLK